MTFHDAEAPKGPLPPATCETYQLQLGPHPRNACCVRGKLLALQSVVDITTKSRLSIRKVRGEMSADDGSAPCSARPPRYPLSLLRAAQIISHQLHLYGILPRCSVGKKFYRQPVMF